MTPAIFLLSFFSGFFCYLFPLPQITSDMIVKSVVLQTIAEHQQEMERGVWVPTVMNRDVIKDDATRLYQLPICGQFSKQLGGYLQKKGLPVYMRSMKGHFNLGIVLADNGQPVEWVIDPTFRQFFTFDLIERGIPPEQFPQEFAKAGLPEILIARADQLEKIFNSFSIKPNWEVKSKQFYIDHAKRLVVLPTPYNFAYFYEPLQRRSIDITPWQMEDLLRMLRTNLKAQQQKQDQQDAAVVFNVRPRL